MRILTRFLVILSGIMLSGLADSQPRFTDASAGVSNFSKPFDEERSNQMNQGSEETKI